MSHREVILDQFSRQAVPFSRSKSMSDAAAIRLLLNAAGAGPEHRSLDVACGPGLVALAFAAAASHATGLDATPAMLKRAAELAAERGIANVDWREGDAAALPFPDDSFDIVTCRFAFHHMEKPLTALREMTRVVRPGGAIVVCDGIASDDPAKAAAFNAFERLRDPSTVRFLTAGELRSLFGAAGLAIDGEWRYGVPAELEALLRGSFPAAGDEVRVRRMMEESLGQDSLGLGARRDGERILFAYPALILAARK